MQISFEAVVVRAGANKSGGSDVETIPLHQMMSENIIVRASNPGQFESDSDNIWSKDCATGAIYHAGKMS